MGKCRHVCLPSGLPGRQSPGTYLGPLRHLPLGPAGWVLADLALIRPGDVSGLAEVAVDGAVESRRDHLPAADDAELVALPAGAGALAPAARLPPVEARRGHRARHGWTGAGASHGKTLPAPGWMETAAIGMSCSQAASVREVFPWDGMY